MKKLICFLLIVLASSACSLDDSGAAQEYFLPVDHVMAPETVNLGETATFTVTYSRPNDCYIFNGFNYQADGNTRTVLVRAIMFDESDCPAYEQESFYDVPLNFTPDHSGTYIFKFWAGNDENEEPIYIEHEVVVANNI